MKVLIAEDEPISAMVLQTLMKPFARVTLAEDGQAAIEAFENALSAEEPFDLLLLDIMMPNVNGKEVLAYIRAVEEDEGIQSENALKVVMTTALDDGTTLYETHATGCSDYIVKPIEKARLLKVLRKLGFSIFDA